MDKEQIYEKNILNRMVMNHFENDDLSYKSELIEDIKYLDDSVEVVYKDGQTLQFSVIKK